MATVNYHLLRKSLGTSNLGKDDDSYLRLSLGEFFAERSEALGCLGGGNNVKRVSMECVEGGRSHSCPLRVAVTQYPVLDKEYQKAYFWLPVLEAGMSRIRWAHLANFW